MISISQIRKQRLREVMSLAPGHRARIGSPISHSVKQDKHSILTPPPGAQVPTLNQSCCVTLSEQLHLSEPVFCSASGPDGFLPTPETSLLQSLPPSLCSRMQAWHESKPRSRWQCGEDVPAAPPTLEEPHTHSTGRTYAILRLCALLKPAKEALRPTTPTAPVSLEDRKRTLTDMVVTYRERTRQSASHRCPVSANRAACPPPWPPRSLQQPPTWGGR